MFSFSISCWGGFSRFIFLGLYLFHIGYLICWSTIAHRIPYREVTMSQSTQFWDSVIYKKKKKCSLDCCKIISRVLKKFILTIFATVLIAFMDKCNFGCPRFVMLEVLLINMSVIYPFHTLNFFELKMNLIMMILVSQTLQASWKATLGNPHPGTIFKITEQAP